MKGSGAFGNKARAAARSPPCASGARELARSEPMSIVATLFALLIEATIGYPQWILRAAGHPVTWIGRLIAWLDRVLNRDDASGPARKLAGFAAVIVLLAVSAGIAAAIAHGLARIPFGTLGVGLLAST